MVSSSAPQLPPPSDATLRWAASNEMQWWARRRPAVRRGAAALGLLVTVAVLHLLALREAMAIDLPQPAARGARLHAAFNVRLLVADNAPPPMPAEPIEAAIEPAPVLAARPAAIDGDRRPHPPAEQARSPRPQPAAWRRRAETTAGRADAAVAADPLPAPVADAVPATSLLLAAAAIDARTEDAGAESASRMGSEQFAAVTPAPAAQDGTARPATPEAADVPVYRTRLPPATLLSYDLRRGPLSGTGELDWRPQGDRYTARLDSKVIGMRVMTLESRGAIDADGIAPLRYTDERRGRGTQAANFRRALGGGGKITYSGPSDEVPLPRGAQDRLTWLVQLAAIAAAEPARVGPGGRVSIFISGARADADVWTFAYVGTQKLSVGERSVTALHLLREPRGANDTRAEVWLDPARHYLPVRARLSNGQGSDAGEAFELMLRE